MDALRSPSTSLRHSPEARPGLLVIIALVLIGGAAGSLGGPSAAVIVAVAGLLWGAVLTLTAARLSRSESRRRAWAAAFVFATVLAGGFLVGSALHGQLIHSAALRDAPQLFDDLVRPPIGDAEALPFLLLNTPLEWLLMPAVLLLTWQVPQQRRLVLTAAVLFVAMRVWTYLYFVPQISDWSQGTAPLTPEQLDQARTWVGLSWIRVTVDIATTVLVLLAAFARTDK